MKGLYQGSLPLVRGGDAVSKKFIVVAIMGLWTLLFSIHYLLSSVSAGPLVPATSNQSSCNSVEQGYQCFPQISRLWGHYSPYFSLEHESTLSTDLPTDCQITLVQVLSRHGARFPTDHKGEKYSELVAGIQRNATSFPGKYAFLESYHYTLGEDDLTTFGQREMMASGTKFYRRYADLARRFVPFIRASGSSRVVASGEKFIRGYQQAKKQDSHAGTDLKTPIIDVVIREGDTYNDTLDHGTCTTFESSELGDDVKANFTALFAPSIRNRLEADLPGVSISDEEVVYLMDLCPFDTVAATSDASQLSPFCALFTHAEWEKYNYLQSLSKYYGYGAGNPLGPAQGIGFTNELIARLTQSPVHDHTSSNSTLDEDLATFPLNATMYADFSHDNAMTGVFFALGLYNGTSPLSQTAVQTTTETDGFSASWTVPFGARTYVEMMQCRGEKEPLVRVLVNDRVVPLHGCKTDELGRCGRADFIQGLSFARDGGNWGECFA